MAKSVLVPIIKGKDNERICDVHRGVKLLEHAMKSAGKKDFRINEW